MVMADSVAGGGASLDAGTGRGRRRPGNHPGPGQQVLDGGKPLRRRAVTNSSAIIP